MNIDWSKAPEWANAVVAASTGTLYFVEAFGVRSKRRAVSNSDDCSRAADMTIKSYSWKLIEERPKKQEAWDGVCIPPIDSECKVVEGPALWENSGVSDWIGRNVKVKSTFTNNIGQQIASVESDNAECACFIVECLRPIKTAEQLAEEEIQAIRDEIRWQKPQLGPCPVAQLYHKGYRKQ